MADARIRRQIALLAARLMYEREEKEYFTAKRKAARQLGLDYKYHPGDLPSNAEIRDQIQSLAQFYEGSRRDENLREMRLAALRKMRLLAAFRPRLIGSVLTGHVRKGSDIDLHVFSNTVSAVTTVLDDENLRHTVEHKRVVKFNEERVFTHVHVHDRFDFELTLYAEDKVHYAFKSSITGRAIERASIAELEQLLREEDPSLDLEGEMAGMDHHLDRFELYRLLLEPLEEVKQNPKYHPEGDALYHSLQVFELARQRVPYDEEFLLAALLHDVGKAIDPADHVAAGLQALEGTITERTEFLIRHHMDAQVYRDGTLGHRAKERLAASEHFEDLMLLRELDTAGRKRGAGVGTVQEARSNSSANWTRRMGKRPTAWDMNVRRECGMLDKPGPVRSTCDACFAGGFLFRTPMRHAITPDPRRPWRLAMRWLAAAGFALAGANHFRNPAFYQKIIPPAFPAPAVLVAVSGVCEIAGGVGLLVRPLRRAAGWGLIALLVAVFPANVYMALHPEAVPDLRITPWLLWVRLPLQAVFIAWVWFVALAREIRTHRGGAENAEKSGGVAL